MESTSRKAKPPDKLANIPNIYLNTSEKDEICLLHKEGKSEPCHSSLPNLAIPMDDGKIGASSRGKKSRGRGSGETDKTNIHRSCLSVFCSPRVTRRGLPAAADTCNSISPGEESSGFIRHAPRRGSGESAETDASLRSISHISTCATSEYTRFGSYDCLSLRNDDSVSCELCNLGRLRRINSNPEGVPLYRGPENHLRDSKSCSDIGGKNSTLVNHSEVEHKLAHDDHNLLSPPSAVPLSILSKLCEEEGVLKSTEELYSLIANDPLMVSQEDLAGKDKRIRQWLNDLYAHHEGVVTSPPAGS